MKIVGIIAEFNPFHNGHKYLIEQAKKITDADNVVVICSGNYVQRGMPSIFDKSERVRMALHNGADAVFELPVFYSTASAELFARASIKFLSDLNCIDYLCFGCETNDIAALTEIAGILSEEPEEYKMYLDSYLKSGSSFPKARKNAFTEYCKSNGLLQENLFDSIMTQPNNILAIEYLKALKHFNSAVRPVPVKRMGAGYDSLNLNTQYASATGIRNQLVSRGSIQNLVPDNCIKIIQNTSPIMTGDFNTVLGYKLLSTKKFDQYFDVSSELSNRINNYKSDFIDIDDFIKKLQSKNFTYSGISRALFHILLDIKKSDVRSFIDNGYLNYARLLGFNHESKILSLVKEKSRLNIIGKLSSYYNNCMETDKKMLDLCIYADELYRMIYMNKYKKDIPTEFERQIEIY
ncbi:MAG: nucleotidyltransferase [Eubacterium sp.]